MLNRGTLSSLRQSGGGLSELAAAAVGHTDLSKRDTKLSMTHGRSGAMDFAGSPTFRKVNI